MAVPKKRKSKQKSRQVKAGGKKRIQPVALQSCPNCGLSKLPHRVCPNCGYYNGRVYKFLAKKQNIKSESSESSEELPKIESVSPGNEKENK